MTELIGFINSFVELDAETELSIRNYFKIETFEKNDFILKEGEICTKISFIKSGLVRRFYINDGEEITNWIYYDNQWLTSMTSFFEQKPSFENLQVCEKTILYSLSYSDEQKLLENHLFSRFHLKLLRQYLASLNEFLHKYRLMTAQEKYSYLLTHCPEVIKRAKLKHVASLMNISQETLSRIRASIN
jgi:CRP-like cAMP-binding protein